MDNIKLKDLSYELYKLMLFIHNRMFDPSELAKHSSLPFSHIKVILYLAKHKGTSISDVANTLSICRSNMTPIVDKLLEENIIARYTDTKDRRVYRIELTELGFEFIRSQEELIKQIISQKLSSLDSNKLDRLNCLILETKDILSEIEEA